MKLSRLELHVPKHPGPGFGCLSRINRRPYRDRASSGAPCFWKATLERVLAVLTQPAQVHRLLEPVLPRDARIGQSGAAVGHGGAGPGHDSHSGRTRRIHSQSPDPVAGCGNGNSQPSEILDGVDLDLLLTRVEPVGGRAASPARIGRVGVVEECRPRYPGWSVSVPR